MKWARSKVDGRDWNATEFSRLDAAWRKASRGGLICLGCGGPAFFRSPSGKRLPTFAAKHQTGCAAVAVNWTVFRYLQ
jgi:hypothetical protein